MAASINVAQPIVHAETQFGISGQAEIRRYAEKLTQTYLQGTPVQLDVAGASGFIIANPAIVSVATAIIAGFSLEPGANLTASGVAKTLVTGFQPQNQPLAVVIPIGAPINDGTTSFVRASDNMFFIGIYGDSNTAANATLAQAQVGTIRGLTKDAGNNFWYVDNFITTAATGACLEIERLIDPVGTLNGRVLFRVTRAAQQLFT